MAYWILVSAQGPLVLRLRVWGKGLTIQDHKLMKIIINSLSLQDAHFSVNGFIISV